MPAALLTADRVARHGARPAILSSGRTFSYADLDAASARAAAGLLAASADLDGARVAFFVPPGFSWTAVAFGVWRAGGVAVPLPLTHPPAELEYIVRDAEAAVVVSDPPSAERLAPVAMAAGARFVTAAELLATTRPDALPAIEADRPAMMLYTSGTTGRPKGVVTTHANLAAQTTALVEAWEWTGEDRTLLVLPLHHVHGIVNVVLSALWTGALCEILPRFEADAVWDRFAAGRITVFTAVPTIYHRLIAAWEAMPEEARVARAEGARAARLMMCGSAALPAGVLDRWRAITGHVLLERYGMTEIGMALANPLHGPRRPGFVGMPLPGVDVRAVDEEGRPVPDGAPGEVEVRGPGVFREYWRRPDATAAAFRDGWFRTGDVAVVEGGAWRLLGRTSVDIIKSGGDKVSALEIEDVLRGHPGVADCAVVGVPDPEWGERVVAAVECGGPTGVAPDDLRAWARERLAPAKVPREVRVVAALPRNAMGKVVKPDIRALFDRDG